MPTHTQRGSSATPTAVKVSYEEFLASLDDETPAEWVNGEVVPMSPVSDEHQLVASFLLTLLKHYVEHHALGVVLYEPFQMKTRSRSPGPVRRTCSSWPRNIGHGSTAPSSTAPPMWSSRSSAPKAVAAIAARSSTNTSRAASRSTG